MLANSMGAIIVSNSMGAINSLKLMKKFQLPYMVISQYYREIGLSSCGGLIADCVLMFKSMSMFNS